MNTEKRKHILLIVAACAMCFPTLCIVIVQATQKIFGIVSIVTLLICAIMIFNAIKNKPAVATGSKEIQKTIKDNAGTIQTINENKPNKNILSKIIAILVIVLSLYFAWLAYAKMVVKYENGNYQLYDAKVVAVKNTTTSETEYDEMNDTYTESIQLSCVVLFEYFDGEEIKVASKTFKGISVLPKESMKIYIENDEILATEYITTAGKILAVGLVILAILSLITIIFNFNMLNTIISLVFIATVFATSISIAVYPTAFVFVEYMPIIALMFPAGVFIFGVGVYEFILNKKQKNKTKLVTE